MNDICLVRTDSFKEAEKALKEFFPDFQGSVISLSDIRSKGFFSVLSLFGQHSRAIFFTFDVRHTRHLFICLLVCFFIGKKSFVFSSQAKPQTINLWVLGQTFFQKMREIFLLPFILAWANFVMGSLQRKVQAKKAFPSRKFSTPRILMLRTDLWQGTTLGGSYSHTRGIREGFLANQCETLLVGVEGMTILSEPDSRFEKTISASTCIFQSDETPEWIFNQRLMKSLPATLETFKPDFIYHRLSLNNVIPAWGETVAHIPVVVEYNGSFPWIHRHWGRPLRFEKMSQEAETLSLQAATLVVTVSEVLVRELLNKNVSPEKILMVPNGVHGEKFSESHGRDRIRTLNQWTESHCVIGFVGTFSAWHGTDVLMKSLPVVLSQNPNIRFLLMGEGPFKKQLMQFVGEQKLESFVVFTGAVSHDSIPDYLSGCDILVSPHVPNPDGSEFFGSPTKLFEYMAAGKAIVASRLGQIGDILTDGKTGVLVPPGDVQKFSQAILDLSQNEDRRRDLGSRAKNEAQKYSWKENAKKIVEKLNELSK